MSQPTARFDPRFSAPDAGPADWAEVWRVLERAEAYWLTTVRADGRPHVTPLVSVGVDERMHFTTGLGEQKARNLEHNRRVALTTGSNAWARGLDVVVEGTVERITDGETLQRIADAYDAKYAGDWHFEVGDGVFRHDAEAETVIFRIVPDKVLAFAKDPHG